MTRLRLSEDVRRLNPGVEVEVSSSSPPSKYHNARTEAHGMAFQSGREAAGVANLILLEQQHQIFALRLQVPFPLQARISYVADAVYLERGAAGSLEIHIVDFKGFKTKEYRMKKKLFEEKYHTKIEEL